MRIVIEINTNNSAFDDADGKEARRILSEVGDMIDNHAYLGPWNKNLKDINGNTVGSFKVIDDQGRELT
tara:strand:+ start:204 stop:410 length:207 start_codon:yes stop_codon:yes gene_type:complete